jgi:large subunit ribosomal protein L25
VLEKGKKIKINVPLEFEGVAPAEKSGHIVVKTLHEVEIEVTPQELPHNLPVDLSKLSNVGDHIVASDITLPPSATLLTDADEIVASVKEFKEEKEEIAPAPETVIIGEEKKEGEAAEGEEAPAAAEKAEK